AQFRLEPTDMGDGGYRRPKVRFLGDVDRLRANHILKCINVADEVAELMPGVQETATLLAWDLTKVNDRHYSGAYVLESLPHAFYCFLRSPGDFQRTLHEAVNSSYDSDTVAAIAGNLSGALNGVRAIPQEFLNDLDFREELEHLAHALPQ
ncbi:MAG: ADP-ribosylglycohydrolase family protein, partial [Verrucomicrobia bacterium]|nr:ADP-ribosylglycohydrolase family protein [Verrucomicrobiota bacterium]